MVLASGEFSQRWKDMKQFVILALLLLATLAIAARPLDALPLQDSAQPPPAAALPTPAQVVGILDSKLSLSDDQKSKITPIIADRQQKLKALQADTSLRPMQRVRKAKAILNESDKKIKANLTPDQQQKYVEIEQQIRDMAKQRVQEQKGGSTN